MGFLCVCVCLHVYLFLVVFFVFCLFACFEGEKEVMGLYEWREMEDLGGVRKGNS